MPGLAPGIFISGALLGALQTSGLSFVKKTGTIPAYKSTVREE
jgi:hypothetical protein